MTDGWCKIKRIPCPHCKRIYTIVFLESRHIPLCYMNPKNLKLCAICETPTKGGDTCSYACSNKHTVRRKATNYVTICFNHHKKQCIVCGEEKIVAVHHNDHNRKNNDPRNLVPLCPTHHTYVHSRFKDEVQPTIDSYVENYVEK